MASSSSTEQLATVQLGALNTVCLQFADSDKKTLKRRATELDNECRSEIKWNMEMKTNLCYQNLEELYHVKEVLDKGKETGLTLSAEEVQRLCQHIETCQELLNEQVDTYEW